MNELIGSVLIDICVRFKYLRDFMFGLFDALDLVGRLHKAQQISHLLFAQFYITIVEIFLGIIRAFDCSLRKVIQNISDLKLDVKRRTIRN